MDHGMMRGASLKGLSRIADNPSRHLQQIAAEMDHYDTREKIDRVLDELDFIHELVDPDAQPKVTEVTNALMERYRALGG